MTRRRNSASAHRLARQMTEMSLAVPHVVTQRVLQMAAAGASPSARDRKEFALMGMEKVLAFYQSWAAMWLQLWRMQMSFMHFDVSQAAGAGARVLSAGLAPVHGKAMANAKRLSRRRR